MKERNSFIRKIAVVLNALIYVVSPFLRVIFRVFLIWKCLIRIERQTDEYRDVINHSSIVVLKGQRRRNLLKLAPIRTSITMLSLSGCFDFSWQCNHCKRNHVKFVPMNYRLVNFQCDVTCLA